MQRVVSVLAILATMLLAGVQAGGMVTPQTNHTRDECIDCTMRYIDVNRKDGFVTEKEMDEARHRYLYWYERSGAEATPTIIHNCDFDRDGKISRQDMVLSNATCLNTQEKLQQYWYYVCQRAIDLDNASARNTNKRNRGA